MEELHVQPKKSPIWPWILLLLVVIGVIWFFVSRNSDPDIIADDDTTTAIENDAMATNNTTDWADINFVSPVLVFSEISDDNVTVRGDSTYGIYAVGEDVFFDTDKATIRPEAENILTEIVGSINQRYENGPIRIYGYTDARGTASYNMELAEDRADAVKDWLATHGIEGSRITKNAIGEAKPVATNSTEEGRQQNRRVEIVARIK